MQQSSWRGTTASCSSSSPRRSSVTCTYEAVLLRQLFRGRVWNAFPGLVVGEGAVWLPPGMPYAIGTDLFADEWTYELRTLRRTQLRVTRPGADYSVFLFLDGWYVNLEEPQRRTVLGWDYEDELLDVWVPFGGEPELLDEDELEEAVARGFITPERSAEIYAKAERVLADPPWPTGWEDWRPEPGWQVPALPAGWEVIEPAPREG